MPTFTNSITADHRKNRERLSARFPAARDFLLALERLYEETAGRFHLGTDQNLHLYLDDQFLIYVRIEALSSSRPALVFSPQAHNDHIKDGTRRAPELLFPKALFNLVERHRGGSGGWAKRKMDRDVDVLRVAAGAPEAFFGDLLAAIRALVAIPS